MRVLLDTNIVLDYLGANQGFMDNAEKVFELAASKLFRFKQFLRIQRAYEDC